MKAAIRMASIPGMAAAAAARRIRGLGVREGADSIVVRNSAGRICFVGALGTLGRNLWEWLAPSASGSKRKDDEYVRN